MPPQGYAPPGAPKKKSKLPLVLGIAAGALVLVVLGVVALFMVVFAAPQLPAGRTTAIFDPPGLKVGTTSVTKSQATRPTFSGTSPCAAGLTAAAGTSDSVVKGESKGVSVLVGRTADAKGAGAVFDAYAAAAKACSSGNLTITQGGTNIGNSNGVTYKTYRVRAGSSSGEMLLMKYGNTWSIVLADSIPDPSDVAKEYGARVKAAAKK